MHQRLESGRSNGLLSSELRDLLTKLEGVMEDLALGREMELSRYTRTALRSDVHYNLTQPHPHALSIQLLDAASYKRLCLLLRIWKLKANPCSSSYRPSASVSTRVFQAQWTTKHLALAMH